eukprot:15364994-Ditylum_brightwellii.AAC.2
MAWSWAVMMAWSKTSEMPWEPSNNLWVKHCEIPGQLPMKMNWVGAHNPNTVVEHAIGTVLSKAEANLMRKQCKMTPQVFTPIPPIQQQ